jgi:FkbM family methyltransferase
MLSLYQLKKALMTPYTSYMRRTKGEQDKFMRAALELHYYRPAFFRFIAATVKNRDILHQADLGADSIVLDVGAYFGHWSRRLYDLYGCQIYAFEPVPGTYRRLLKESSGNWNCQPYGLGERTEQTRFSLNSMGASAFELGRRDRSPKYTTVDLRDISEVWRELDLDRVDLMKINIEGGEFPLLERMADTELLGKVNSFLIQFHEWHPGAYHRRRRLRRRLRKTHQLQWDYPFVWEYWKRKRAAS